MDFVLWLFSIGYLFQLAAALLLVYTVRNTKSVFGLSRDTQIIFFIAQIARVIWIFDTRLYKFPLASLELLLNVLLAGYAVYLCNKYKATNLGTTPTYFQALPITACCGLLCLFLHPGDKGPLFFTIQMLVSFTIFMECSGLIPQFLLMVKRGEVEGITKHYVMMMGLARLFRMAFWTCMWFKGDSFMHLIIADLVHTVILADFAFLYYKSMVSGKRLLLGR